MKLLVIVLCLLSERFLIHAISYQRFSWFNQYLLFIDEHILKGKFSTHPPLLLACYILPIILISSLIYLSMCSVLFGFVGLLLSLLLFYYCLGPKNPFYPEIPQAESADQESSIKEYLAVVNNQLFAVIFWYIVGGPIAALFFRMVSLFQSHAMTASLAKDITEVLEWIPARMTVLLYLLVGNFQSGFKILLSYLVAKPAENQKMLVECGMLALKTDETNVISMPAAQTLVEHAVIVLLVLVALFTMASWL